MSKHMLEDPDNKYMEFKDIKLKNPLLNVKRTNKKNDTLIIPDNLLPIISRFFEAENISYQIIENPALYPADKLKSGLKAYEDCSPVFLYEEPVLFISPFDANALFEWSKQLFGENIDPSYQAYLDDQRRASEDYYWKYVAE